MNAINQNIAANENTSNYVVVKMLMENSLKFMQEAACAFDGGSGENWCASIVKAHSYILGLRASLDMELGGSLADNLDGLYGYMLDRLNIAFENVDVEALAEVYELMEEVKLGWDGIEDVIEDPNSAVACA